MIQLDPIELSELTKADVSALLNACAQDKFGMQFKHLLNAIQNRLMAIYRWSGDFNGIMIIKINLYPGGKELFVWHLAGRGLFKNIVDARSKIKELARSLGCRWVSGSVTRKGMEKFYDELSTMKAVYYRMEA